MYEHDYFEELCALAASGQIGESDWQLLHAHLDSCRPCAELLGAFGAVSTGIVSTPTPVRVAEKELRSRFFRRAVNEGWLIESAARQSWFFVNPWRWAVSAAVAAVFAIGMGLGWTMHGASAQTPTPIPPRALLAPARQDPPANSQAASWEQERNDLLAKAAGAAQQRDGLQIELQLAVAHSKELEARIGDLTPQLSADNQALAALRSAHDSVVQRLSETDSALSKSKAEQLAQEVQVVAQQNELKQVNDRLLAEHATLERDKALLAVSSPGKGIIASRNLHIVDVYDDSTGKSKSSFGRVFYVEGKELIFYAYDLPVNRNVQYYVWGKTLEGTPIARLGIFHNDGGDERRWVLRLDASGLTNLDSLFVTAENGRDADRPKGKRMLYAVLGEQPNHP